MASLVQVLRRWVPLTPRPGQVGTALGHWRHLGWSRDRLLRFQDRRLRRVVRFAGREIPYYRDLYRQYGVDLEGFRGARDLPALPLTTKLELRRVALDDLLPPEVEKNSLVPGRTSGSSGLKLFLRREPFEQHLLHTFRMRAWLESGVRTSDRMALVAMRFPHAVVPTFRLTRLRQAAGLFRQTSVNAGRRPEEVLEELASLQPDVLTGYAGVLHGVARAAREQGFQGLRPRLVISVAERLNPMMRREIEDALSTKVVDFYVSMEYNLQAWQCRQTGLYHLCEDNVAIEVLDKDGQPVVEDGQVGEIVTTGLHAFTTPLLRYRLGDVVERGPTPCPCGRPFATLRSIQGRTMEYFRRGDGSRIHHWELARHTLAGSRELVDRYQFVQETGHRIVMRLVPARPLTGREIGVIEAAGQDRLTGPVRFEVEIVDQLPTAPSGKMIQSLNFVDSPNIGDKFDPAAWHRDGGDTES